MLAGINDPTIIDTRDSYPKEPIIATVIILFIFWSLLIGLSLYLNLSNLRSEIIALATTEAKANWNKDQAFRGWATRHGGLYVKPDSRTPPNPYLAHVAKRDLVTSDGTALTLMNPAYMMRQMTQEYEATYGIKGSITGKILLNPINAPDEWEKKVLDEFERGVKEFVEVTSIDGDPYVRYMKPMIMVKGCVKCHGHLGFKVGDIRGGVSVSIPLKPYHDTAAPNLRQIKISHTSIWFLGCFGIFGFAWSARTRERERHKLQRELALNQNMLEEQVIERTRELKLKEKALRVSQARAHHANKMASLGQMASGIAHEINSPLQAILLTASRVKRKVGKMDGIAVSGAMDMVEGSIANISRIIESLKNMSRNSGGDPFVDEAVKDIIRDATGITIDRFKTNGVKFDVCYHGDSKKLSLICQRLQIAQILINLLNNAFDAVMESQDKWISLDVHDGGETINLSIIDSGAGIPIEIQDRIFEPLYTSKDIGRGTGLGLSISAEIAKKHGGTLELDTRSANTRFVLTLPKFRPDKAPQD